MSQELKDAQSDVESLIYRTAEEMPEAIKEMIYKEWLPSVMAANLKAVRELPPEYRDYVLKGMSEGCGPMAVAVCGTVITSSPLPTPQLARARWIASVPLPTPIPKRTST